MRRAASHDRALTSRPLGPREPPVRGEEKVVDDEGSRQPVSPGEDSAAGQGVNGRAGADGQETAAEELAVLYVPAYPQVESKELAIETRFTPSGERLALGFTTVTRLTEELGHFQPWVAMKLDRLQGIARDAGVRIALDPSVPPDAPRWTEADLRRYAPGTEGAH